MSQCLLQKLQQCAPRFDFAVVNECSGFDSQCLGEIRIGLYSCSYGLHNVSTRCSVKSPIARIFQCTSFDVLAKIGAESRCCFEFMWVVSGRVVGIESYASGPDAFAGQPAPTGFVAFAQISATSTVPVGASLLAKAICQALM